MFSSSKSYQIKVTTLDRCKYLFLCLWYCYCLLGVSLPGAQAQVPWANGKLVVAPDGHNLQHENGTPFFWMGDTAWELFHRLEREEADQYLQNRADKKYNVIQAVCLAELGSVTPQGIEDPNPYGDIPLVNQNPMQPDVTPGDDPGNPTEYDYWDHVDYIIDKAESLGLYIGMLPTWGYWVNGGLVNSGNSEVYGQFIGDRYKDKPNIIWILGGDRIPDTSERQATWRAMAAGIIAGTGGDNDAILITYHSRAGAPSSNYFHNDYWLDFNMIQSGHICWDVNNWDQITHDYYLLPIKPTIDGEPCYEDHIVLCNRSQYFRDHDARKAAYRAIFAGALGHTYGHSAIWQMYHPPHGGINGTEIGRYWDAAMDRPGGVQMTYVVNLMMSRPLTGRLPDQSILQNAFSGGDHTRALLGDDYLFVYSPAGRAFTVNMGRIGGSQLHGWWYNPRDGQYNDIGLYNNSGSHGFSPPSSGGGNDWVLVLDNADRTDFPLPGQDIFPGNLGISIPAPSNVFATPISATEINIIWQDNSSSSDQEDGFIIQRLPYQNNSSQWQEVGRVDEDITTFIDSDSLHGMVQYHYRVGAFKN